MHKLIFVFLSFLAISYSCQKVPNPSPEFQFPELINSDIPDSIERKFFQSDSIAEVFPLFIGKFSVSDDTIDIRLQDDGGEELYGSHFLRQKTNVGIEDSLDVNGFEVYVDYQTDVKYYDLYRSEIYYPVYFVNTSSSDKVFLGKDNYAFGIQEAYDLCDDDGAWKPVEARGFSFCGNGYWGLVVKPQEFVLILMRKYEGNMETAIRLRFSVGESIYVSKPFMGYVNEKQFSYGQELKEHLRRTNGVDAFWLFYGAVPEQSEWIVKSF